MIAPVFEDVVIAGQVTNDGGSPLALAAADFADEADFFV